MSVKRTLMCSGPARWLQEPAINLVISGSSNATFGGDTSAEWIIDNNLAKIIGYSYGQCEFFLGTAGNAFYGGSPISEGFRRRVETGSGAGDHCNRLHRRQRLNRLRFDPNTPFSEFGVAVNGVASTPYNVAVGGTDFNDVTNPTTYWNSSNPSTTTQASVKGYIPEVTYNDTCTNSVIEGVLDLGGDIEFECNDIAFSASLSNFSFLLDPAGGSGGVSACTTSNYIPSNGTGDFSTCSGGYPKPSWQTALTVADGKRDMPDFAIFAGDGTMQNFYLYCEQDADQFQLYRPLQPVGQHRFGSRTRSSSA